jgi:hypothetical protein
MIKITLGGVYYKSDFFHVLEFSFQPHSNEGHIPSSQADRGLSNKPGDLRGVQNNLTSGILTCKLAQMQ